MKIGILGSAPSSLSLAPYADPSWYFFGCSPGVYGVAARCEEWFELHRWEPGIVGKPHTQKPWFSPEYVQWMKQHPCVWMILPEAEVPNSRSFPYESLINIYGHYFFTSTVAWMLAMAIERIKTDRAKRPAGSTEEDVIGLWGVDMAANEEYGYQRAGCQFFLQLVNELGIKVVIPPESDLLIPAPQYGLVEHSHAHVKLLARKREIEGRLAAANQAYEAAKQNVQFLMGAMDDVNYMMNTWTHQGPAIGAQFGKILGND